MLILDYGIRQQSTSSTYYVKNGGNNSLNGLSDANTWETIAKVNATTFSPGDTILLKRGSQWRETLTPGQSGTSVSAYITYGAYDSEALPILNGADIVTGWANQGSNVWSVNCPVYDDYGFFANDVHYMCIVSGVMFTQVDSQAAVNSASKYFVDSSVSPSKMYIYSTSDPASTVEISARMFGCLVNDKKYIKIEYIDFRNVAHSGLFLHSISATPVSGYHLVTNCNFYRNRESGCYIDNGLSDNLVEYCTSSYNGNGYYIWSDDVNNSCTRNTYAHNLSEHSIYYQITNAPTDGHGFGIYNSNNNVIEYNESNDDRYGINIDVWGGNNSIIMRYNYVHDGQVDSPAIQCGGNMPSGASHQIYYNLIVNCAGGADAYPLAVIGASRTGHTYLYNNTIYQDGNAARSIYGIFLSTSNNSTIKNNIVYNNASSAVVLALVRIESNCTIDNNLYYAPTQTYPIFYNAGYVYGLAAWQALGYDANGISDDPDFVNVASDWSLQSTSPAINTGANVSLTSDILGHTVGATPDMGAYEYQA